MGGRTIREWRLPPAMVGQHGNNSTLGTPLNCSASVLSMRCKATSLAVTQTLIETGDGGRTWGGISVEAETGQIQRIQFDEAIRWKRAVGFYGLHFSTPQHGWGVGELGKILHTKDGGRTWQSQDSGDLTASYSNLNGVYFVDATVGWIVGDAGVIIKTGDGGETWVAQRAGPNQLRAVFALNPQIAWIAGDDGSIYATKDGGETWIQQITPTAEKLNGVYFVTESKGWAVGEKGMLLNTKDGGVTWLIQQTPTSNGLIDITQSPDGVLWVVGEWGTVLKY